MGAKAGNRVWLPPGYAQESPRHPVVNFLLGATSTRSSGPTEFVPPIEAAIKEGQRPPCFVVLVNGRARSFFCDATDSKFPLESVIIEGLIAHIAATYRTFARREGRIIEGYSRAVTARRTSAASIPPTSALA